ncbi:hypothetical protein ACFSTC_26615 [Nonomuraea ferruginea]
MVTGSVLGARLGDRGHLVRPGWRVTVGAWGAARRGAGPDGCRPAAGAAGAAALPGGRLRRVPGGHPQPDGGRRRRGARRAARARVRAAAVPALPGGIGWTAAGGRVLRRHRIAALGVRHPRRPVAG